jgi:hypothetical protein
MRPFFCIPFISLLFLLSRVNAQVLPSSEDARANVEESPDFVEQVATAFAPEHREEHPRLFWIIPTYSVSSGKAPSMLSRHDKFHLFAKNAIDPYNLGYTAFSAALAQASNDQPGYGQGVAGYCKRLGSGLADETSAGFFTTFLFPSALHQDPRYFRQGSGPFLQRLMHAVIRPLVTRKDSGGRTFNWAGLLGSTAASGLSNAYYPAADRGVETTFTRVGWGVPFSVIDHVIDEFGADLERRFLEKKPALAPVPQQNAIPPS